MMINCTRKNEKETDEEEFYESLDRILSCSSSSCSSDNEDGSAAAAARLNHHSGHTDSAPSLSDQICPPYDVWTADPAPVHERRQKLLARLGLASDTTLSRFDSNIKYPPCPPTPPAKCSEGGRSASCGQLMRLKPSDDPRVIRSCSDSAVSGTAAVTGAVRRSCSNNGCTLLVPPCLPTVTVDSNHPWYSSVPNGEISPQRDKERSPGHSSSSSLLTTCNHPDDDSDSPFPDSAACTIKNLDSGKEFIVNEIGDDGLWNKLWEVGTGRQLTREEFDRCIIGHSPIVQELMRRQNVEESISSNKEETESPRVSVSESKLKKKGNWLKSIKHVASTVTGHHRERRSSDERDTSSEKGGRRSSSATDDSQDILFPTPERTKVRQYGKSSKELTALYMSQELQGHNGSIWTVKFSLDGCYLASAGQDRVIHIWQVVESERSDFLSDKLEGGNSHSFLLHPETNLATSNGENNLDKRKRGKVCSGRKSVNLDHILLPDNIFALLDKPVCSFQGHQADVLDLSWSKSEYLLSSSMDKTVRLWHMSSKSCLKMFSHSDFVTCIQFNPVDDRYFISGSLDAKVRLWSIPDRQVVDWNDIHEMVTAACYSPDGQGAMIGSHKGGCHLYGTSDNKLQIKKAINLQRKKKKSHIKKITGFQFAPGNSSEFLITSADSRIRVVDGVDLIHKFKGFRNTSSQISAGFTSNGKYVVCASEDSHVYIWRYDSDARPNRDKGVTVTRSYEHFHCRDVSVAIPWPGIVRDEQMCGDSEQNGNSTVSPQWMAKDVSVRDRSLSVYECAGSPLQLPTSISSNSNCFSERASATWPEEKLFEPILEKPVGHVNYSRGSTAWGMVIVTAGLGGDIKVFQNFGLPVPI